MTIVICIVCGNNPALSATSKLFLWETETKLLCIRSTRFVVGAIILFTTQSILFWPVLCIGYYYKPYRYAINPSRNDT